MNRCLFVVLAGVIGVSAGCNPKPVATTSTAASTSTESTPPSTVVNAVAMPDAEPALSKAETVSASSPANASEKPTSELTIIAWNVESGGADPKVISQRLSKFHADIYGLSEVHPNDFETFRTAVGDGYDEIHLPMGNDDRLQLIYSAKRFQLLERIELSNMKSTC